MRHSLENPAEVMHVMKGRMKGKKYIRMADNLDSIACVKTSDKL